MVVTNSTVALALINVYHKGVFAVMCGQILVPKSQISQNSLCNWSISVEPPLLSTSAGIPSFPGDFPDAVCLRARSISVTDGTWNPYVSCICHTVKIASVVPLPGINPNCIASIFTFSLILRSSTRSITFIACSSNCRSVRSTFHWISFPFENR